MNKKAKKTCFSFFSPIVSDRMKKQKTKTKSKKRGRPSVPVAWPNEEFTAKDVVNSLKEATLTPTAIRVKIRKAVKNGLLERVGKKSDSVGRPLYTYRKLKEKGVGLPN